MKYAIILPDGAADHPLPQLGGRTPLQAARIPNMDWIARHGRLGRVVTIPDGFTPGTDVATLTLFGYDPATCYTGRAPIEAAAQGLTVAPDELIFRCNFVTIRDGRMKDFTAGHIAQAEAERLIADLSALARAGEPALAGCKFHAGVGYRNLMLASGAADMQLKCAPPHDIPNQPVADHLPRGGGQERVRAIMARAATLLKDHEVNRARRAAGREPVTDIWLWGQGRPTKLTPFVERFGVRGAAITGVDIIRGLAVLMGMHLIVVPGATGYLDTDYAGKGAAAAAALDQYDLVVVHAEAPDEAAHEGSAEKKVTALERVDEHVVGPVLAALRRHGQWRILVAPDHVTAVASTAHEAGPPPFCFAGHDVPADRAVPAGDAAPAGHDVPGGPGRPFSEPDAVAGGLLIDPGYRLIELFFRGASAT
jgi:2,3-bisphosphoglycerate-independent phosphoglycerate mutase